MDGELLGVRLERSHTASGPGRGVLVGVRAWAETDAETAHWRLLDAAEPTPVQIALPDPPDPQPAQPSAMWGYR
jgi:hypothetical protein